MIRKVLKVENPLGLHARAAAKLVRLASRFRADIKLSRLNANQLINGKSILGILMLAAGQGTDLVFTISGDDEVEAVAAIEQLLAEGFGERT